MNNDSFQILQPKKIKIASLTPFWRLKDYFTIIFNTFFKNSRLLKNDIVESIVDIHNIDFKYSYFVDSGKSAIYFSLKALNLNKGDKVIIPSFTCRAVLFALLEAKVEPIFADIDEDYNLNLETLISIDDLDDIKAIILPNMYGKINCNYQLIKKLKRKGIIIIEDNATSFGSAYDSEILSDAMIYSFNMGKMINGSGGGIVFLRSAANSKLLSQIKDQKKIEVIIRFIKDLIVLRYRKKSSYFISLLRKKVINKSSLDDFYSLKDMEYQVTQKYFNCKKISKLSLLLVSSQLKDFRKIKQLYANLLDTYNANLGLSSRFSKNEVPSYFLLEIDEKTNRYSLGDYLSNQGIECSWSYYPIHKIKIYKDIKQIDNLAITNKKWSNFLYLPFNLFVTRSDVEFVCKCYEEFMKKHEK